MSDIFYRIYQHDKDWHGGGKLSEICFTGKRDRDRFDTVEEAVEFLDDNGIEGEFLILPIVKRNIK